jgi:hypothetical protein
VSRRAALVAAALVALLAVACGGSSPSMDGDAAARLHTQVTAVRDAVMVRDADGAARALQTLRTSVAHLRRSGHVTDAKATQILAAADAVATNLVSITTTTTTTTTVPPPPSVDAGKGKGDHGNGKGDAQQQGED